MGDFEYIDDDIIIRDIDTLFESLVRIYEVADEESFWGEMWGGYSDTYCVSLRYADRKPGVKLRYQTTLYLNRKIREYYTLNEVALKQEVQAEITRRKLKALIGE